MREPLLLIPLLVRELRRSGALGKARPRGVLRALRTLARGRRDFFALVSAHAASRPDDPAVSDETGTWSWSELHGYSLSLATALRAAGVERGTRVALALDNRRAYFCAMGALLENGAIPVPLSPSSPTVELASRLARTQAKLAIVEARHAGAMDGAIVAEGPAWEQLLATPAKRSGYARLRRGDDPDVLMYTSGTTGRSRGARLNLRSVPLATVFGYLETFDLRADDVLYTPCPLYHAAPMLLTGLCFVVGAEVRVGRAMNPDALRGVTHAFLVPTLLERLLEGERIEAPGLRALISGGAALRADSKLRLLDRFGPVLYDFYGATELGVVSIARPDELRARPWTVGKPLPGVEVKLAEDGELWVRSAALNAYEDGEEEGPFPGFGSAGDIAKQDAEGYLAIVDRKKDVVITGGVNVFPAEVEEELARHPAIRDVACAGIPDPQWGESLEAFIVSEQALDEDQLRAFCRERMAPFRVPKRFHRVDEIPRSPAGKVLRRELRARVA